MAQPPACLVLHGLGGVPRRSRFRRDMTVQCDRLEADLVRLAGSLGLAFERSLYWATGEEAAA